MNNDIAKRYEALAKKYTSKSTSMTDMRKKAHVRRFEILQILRTKKLISSEILTEIKLRGFEATDTLISSDLTHLKKYLNRKDEGKGKRYSAKIGEGFTLEMYEQGLEATPVIPEQPFIAKMFGYNDILPDPKAGKTYTEKEAVREPKEHHRHVRHYASGASLSGQYSIVGV